MHPLPTAHETAHAQALLHYIDQSPSPWHAVDTTKTHLEAAGYLPLEERDLWKISPGARHYVIRGDSSIIAFRLGTLPPSEAGFRILGAHTDSPDFASNPTALFGKGVWSDWALKSTEVPFSRASRIGISHWQGASASRASGASSPDWSVLNPLCCGFQILRST